MRELKTPGYHLSYNGDSVLVRDRDIHLFCQDGAKVSDVAHIHRGVQRDVRATNGQQ